MDSRQNGKSRSMRPQQKCWRNIGPTSNAIPIFGESLNSNPSISSVEDSHAKMCLAPESGPELPGIVPVSIGSYYEPFAWFDRNTRSWRTWERSWTMGWELFSGIWPKRGKMSNGIAYRLVSSERHIHGKECSYWPTPVASLCHSGFSIGIARHKAGGGKLRKSGVRIGSSMKWDEKLIEEYEKTRNGFPNPRFLEWLMGFPQYWTKLDVSETPLSPKSHRKSER